MIESNDTMLSPSEHKDRVHSLLPSVERLKHQEEQRKVVTFDT